MIRNIKKMRPLPPLGLLRSRLRYDPDTGVLVWAQGRANEIGRAAGHIATSGYRIVSIGNLAYLAHRIAWAIHHGEDPGAMEIDHINGVRSDLRIQNLRKVMPHQNSQNRSKTVRNTSGFAGVKWRPSRGSRRDGCWVAYVFHQKKYYHVGEFQDAAEASVAREAFARQLRGEFHRN